MHLPRCSSKSGESCYPWHTLVAYCFDAKVSSLPQEASEASEALSYLAEEHAQKSVSGRLVFFFLFLFAVPFVYATYSKESGHELLALNAEDSDPEDDYADYEGMEATAKERDGVIQAGTEAQGDTQEREEVMSAP